MSPSLKAETGGATVTGTIVSGSLALTPNTQGSSTVSGYAIQRHHWSVDTRSWLAVRCRIESAWRCSRSRQSKFLYVANRVSNVFPPFRWTLQVEH